MNEFERTKSRHPAMIHWQRREAALASEGITPRLSWWQKFRSRPRPRMLWRY